MQNTEHTKKNKLEVLYYSDDGIYCYHKQKQNLIPLARQYWIRRSTFKCIYMDTG